MTEPSVPGEASRQSRQVEFASQEHPQRRGPRWSGSLVHDVLRHRLVLSYEALSDNVTAEQLIDRVLQKIPAPTQALQERVPAKA